MEQEKVSYFFFFFLNRTQDVEAGLLKGGAEGWGTITSALVGF